MSEDDPYLYPGSPVLRNRLGLTDPDQLDKVERRLVAQRIAEGAPTGGFDLAHLRAIHRHLFQDIYAWAGELRTVEIAKGGHQFQFRPFIETGMDDVHCRLEQAGCAIDLAWIDPGRWLEASWASHGGDHEPMTAEIGRALAG